MLRPPARAARMLSAVIPLAADETAWPGLLEQLRALPEGSEVILVRCGDTPVRRPAGWPAHLGFTECLSPQGRARQMNVGAQAARGRWLWFLHADTRLTPPVLPALLGVLRHDEEALGYFDLAFAADGPRLTRLNALGANLRSRWLGLPFGDQGFILPARTFHALGGYDERAASGEDHRLVWALRAKAVPLIHLDATLVSSARKYARHGWLATTAHHVRLTTRQAWGGWRELKREPS